MTTGTVVINHATGNGITALRLTVTGVSPTATISNFHLYAPGYGSNPTQMFTNAFLQSLKPFSTIRFENWNAVINSTTTSWQERAPPTSFLTTTNLGVPYEDIIELCNEAQKDMWINIPALATPSYVQSLAQLIDSELDPNLNVYVEYSDETWNAAWLEYSQVLQAAGTNPLVTATTTEGKIAQQSAYELFSIGQTFDQAFGSSSSRVRPVIGAWSIFAAATAGVQLQFIQSNYGAPANYVYAVAIAPYVGLPSGDDVAGLTENQLFADLNTTINTQYVSSLQSSATVAQSFGLPLVTYEGGTSLPSGYSGLNAQVKQESAE